MLALGVSAECIEPTDSINANTVLCEGEYYLPGGIIISADSIVLDCNNAIIKGNFVGTGIILNGRENVELYNCNVQDFDTGIRIEDSTKITFQNSSLINNKVGMRIINSPDNIISNIHDESIKQPVIESNTITEECIGDSCDEPIPEEAVAEPEAVETSEETQDTPNKQIIENVPDDAVKTVPIRKFDSEIARNAVKIEKTKTIKNSRTFYETRITALKDIKGLTVYEYFPKEVAEHVRDINFDEKMILVEEDPIVKKDIKEMKKDETVTITYDVNKIVAGDTNPTSVVTIENSSLLIKLLANISYILGIYLFYVLIKRYKADKMSKKLEKRTKRIWGVPLHLPYFALLIPNVNYALLLSESIAVIVHSVAIIVFLSALMILAKKKG